MNDFPRGLLVIMFFLAIGFCGDASMLYQGGPTMYVVILVALILGKIACIVGILMRTQTGWILAVSFFGVMAALNLLAFTQVTSVVGIIRLGLTVACLGYLITMKSEFDQ